MKKLSASLLAFAVALAIAPAAHADTTPGWYIGAGLGAAIGQDPIVHLPAGQHSARDEDASLALQGSGGYAWANGLRLEGEYYHNQVNVNGMEGSAGAGGHVSNNALFANVLYDFNNGSRYTPYIGAGVGPDWVNVKGVGATSFGYLNGDDVKLGYQAIAGVSAQLDQNWAVTADYRYVASTDPKVGYSGGGEGRMDNASHNIMLGLRYSFPVATTPMQSAQAPVVPTHSGSHVAVAGQTQDFMVFFDFNKSVLTPEAKRIIASAAQEFKNGGAAKITIIGHTDTVGTAAYNDKLSVRRAKAVEDELAKLGVSKKAMVAHGVGKDGLMVPTANGVREAQNRRAEILLSK